MPSLSIDIALNNSAFTEYPDELNRVLSTAIFATQRARRAKRSETISLFDTNGNRVGDVHYQHGDKM